MSVAWRLLGDASIPLDAPRVVGILNATPDSFSDGGRHLDPEAAGRAAAAMAAAGAAMLDVGGESTRPGATRVDEAEQVRRAIPVIEAARAACDLPISIDTTRAAVAAAALDAGAVAVNDVSGGTEDPALLPLVAASGAGLVLMHRLRPPEADAYSDRYETPPDYGDVVEAVAEALAARLAAAVAAGVAPERIVLDPGLGFGKSVADCFALVRGTPRLLALGRPLLGATSRKSFLGAVTGLEDPVARDLPSTAAAVRQHALGVRLFRVHDVAAHVAALAVSAAVDGA